MAGYRIDAAAPAVLAALALGSGTGGAHQPESYSVLVAAAEGERWAEVTCTCGSVGRVPWTPGTTRDFRAALAAAWALRECASSDADPAA